MNSDPRPSRIAGPRLVRRIGMLAFPLIVWWVGSFFLLGDLGKWIDDYAAHVRDPVTGTFSWIDMLRPQWWFFWRPIHVQLVFALQTLLWNHDWANHLFSALMHALACLSLWHFLKECGVRPLIAACAAIIMLASPQAFEAIFWPATVSTSIACAAYFFAGRIVIRFAQHRHKRGAIIALGALGLIIPSLYEQPAAALAVLPILYAAAAWPRLREVRLWHEARRGILFLTPCALGVIVYLLAFMITVRRDEMARESQFVGADLLAPRTTYMLRTLGELLNPLYGFNELISRGLRTLENSALGLIGLGAALLALAFIWIGAWHIRSRSNPAPAPATRTANVPPSNRVLLVLFALFALVLALLPIIAIRGAGLSPRLMYFPLACVILACAATCDGLFTQIARKWGRFASIPLGVTLQLAVIAYAAFGITALVGAQAFSRARFEKDRAQLSALRELIPDPAPGTLFVPLRVSIDTRDPQAPRLRNSYGPIWSSPWGVNTAIKHAYRRADVHATCIYLHNQATAIARMGDPVSIAWSHYCWNLPTPRMENAFPRIAVESIVPFTIDADGKVALVERLTVGALDGQSRSFTFSQVTAAHARGGTTADITLALPLDSGGDYLSGWRWAARAPSDPDSEAKFLRIASWEASERATRMHPIVPGYTLADGDTHEMAIDLAPSDQPRTLVFHATFAEDNIDLSTKGDGVELLWSIDSDAPLQTLSVDPARAKSERRWDRVEVIIPPLDHPRTLRVTCTPGPKRNTSCDRVVVSCGIDLSKKPDTPIGIPTPHSR